MRYPGVLEVWYNFAGTLKELVNDFGAIELINLSKTNGKIDLYILHPISQSDVVEVVDVQPVLTYVQPTEQQTEGQPKILETLPEILDTETLSKIPDTETLPEIHG